MVSGFDLSGKTALITGATRGIGKIIGDVFIDNGANLFFTGTNSSKIAKLNKQESNPKIKWLDADFSTSKGINIFLDKLDGNNIDICVNNAGLNIIKPFTDFTSQDYKILMNTNLAAPFSITKHLIPSMVENGYGRIVNVASIWSKITKSERSLYTISKTGLVGFTKSMAVEYASSNVLVNAVSPGFTKTDLTARSLTKEEIDTISNQIPIGRFAEPIEIANIILFLCSNSNTYITGQNIVADGGFTLV